MQIQDYSIEYSHIYTYQTFGPEHIKAIELMKEKEKELQKKGLSVARHVLIDDYSTAVGLDRFDTASFYAALSENNADPDQYVLESSLVPMCEKLLLEIKDKKLKKSIRSFYESRGKWPCSMCVAAWYLVRLGKLEHPNIELKSQRIITIVPDRFKSPEDEAREIIGFTKYKDTLSDIEVIFFESIYNGYSNWNEFDPTEYSQRNYLKTMMPEDEVIINFASKYLKNNYNPKTFMAVADVGAGPNLYPTFLLFPYINENGVLELIDPAKPNRDFLLRSIKNNDDWSPFVKTLHKIDPSIYSKEIRLPADVNVKNGSIFDLPENAYDCVASFFVAESITDDIEEVKKAMDSLKLSVKPGGMLITSHMLGSNGYFAGMLTSFPATPINLEEMAEFYSDFEDVQYIATSHNENYDPRKGYKGMGVIAGKKPMSV